MGGAIPRHKDQSSDISHAACPRGLSPGATSGGPHRAGTAPQSLGHSWNPQHRDSRGRKVGQAPPLHGHRCLYSTAGMFSLSQGTIKHQEEYSPWIDTPKTIPHLRASVCPCLSSCSIIILSLSCPSQNPQPVVHVLDGFQQCSSTQDSRFGFLKAAKFGGLEA